jgi:hypothetical protein
MLGAIADSARSHQMACCTPVARVDLLPYGSLGQWYEVVNWERSTLGEKQPSAIARPDRQVLHGSCGVSDPCPAQMGAPAARALPGTTSTGATGQ